MSGMSKACSFKKLAATATDSSLSAAIWSGVVEAPRTGDVVKVQGVYLEGYVGAVRPAAS